MASRRLVGVAAAVVLASGVAGCASSETVSATPRSSESPSVAPATSKSPSPAEQSAAAELEKAIGATRDQAFLGILQISSLQYGQLKFGDDATLIATAQKTCADERGGRPRSSVVADVAQNYGGDTARADYFVTQATSSFCPEVVPK